MGDVTKMIMDGLLCQECGGAMEDINEYCDGGESEGEVPGYPRTCEDCLRDD